MDKRPAFESFYNSDGELIVYTGSGNAMPPDPKPVWEYDSAKDPNNRQISERLSDCQKAVLCGGIFYEVDFGYPDEAPDIPTLDINKKKIDKIAICE